MSWARACKGVKAARGETWVSVFFEEDDAIGDLEIREHNIHKKGKYIKETKWVNE
jgi:hypothetical protein